MIILCMLNALDMYKATNSVSPDIVDLKRKAVPADQSDVQLQSCRFLFPFR